MAKQKKIIFDKNNNRLSDGDWVKYWHRRDNIYISSLNFGKILDINNHCFEPELQIEYGKNGNVSLRKAKNVVKASDEEVFAFLLGQ